MIPFRQITVETIDLQNDDNSGDECDRSSLNVTSIAARKRSCSNAQTKRPCEKKRVRFLNGSAGSDGNNNQKHKDPLLLVPLTISTQQYHPNIFSDLLRKACRAQISTSRCPGLSQTSRSGYRHVFHSSEDCSMRTCCQSIMPCSTKVMSLFHALQKPVDESISMLDQYRLARSLVLGVLQFNGTGWLADEWNPEDVAIFSKDSEFSSPALRTLHYTKRLPFTKAISDVHRMEGIETSEETSLALHKAPGESLRSEGILNQVMYCLGLQLIRIASWSVFPDISPAKARKLVEPCRRPPLGDRYRELARKCLDCDFGFGKDLTNIALQKAIYKDVVMELDGLIESVAALDLQED